MTLTTGPNTSSQTTFMLGFDSRQHGRLECGAVTLAAGYHPRTRRCGFLHPAFDPPRRGLVDERTDVGGGIERIAELQLAHLRLDQAQEGLAYALVNVDALHRNAALPGEAHRVAPACRRRGGEIGVVVHDGGAIAAQLQRNAPQPARRFDGSPSAARPGERDEFDARVGHQRRTDLGAAVHHVEHAGRQAGFDDKLGQAMDDERCLWRRLQHHRVARCDRWRNLVSGKIEGGVEGRDRGDDADRESA